MKHKTQVGDAPAGIGNKGVTQWKKDLTKRMKVRFPISMSAFTKSPKIKLFVGVWQ